MKMGLRRWRPPSNTILGKRIAALRKHCDGCGKRLDLLGVRKFDIHHIDGNWSNNKEENIQILCRSCHAKTKEIRRTKLQKRLGYKRKDLPVRYRVDLRRWEEIAGQRGAVNLGFGLGYVRHSKNIDLLGYTLQEIGNHMGISRERVRQLIERNSYRIGPAVAAIDKQAEKGFNPI